MFNEDTIQKHLLVLCLVLQRTDLVLESMIPSATDEYTTGFSLF